MIAVSFDLLPESMAHIEAWKTGVWMLRLEVLNS
jgi:hypothetical protein